MLASADVQTALRSQLGASTDVGGLSAAASISRPMLNPRALQHPSPRAPSHTHARPRFPCTFVLCRGAPAQGHASVSVAASSIPRMQVPTQATLCFACTPAPHPAHALTHALTLTLPALPGKSATMRPTPAACGHRAGMHTRPICCETPAAGTARQPASSSRLLLVEVGSKPAALQLLPGGSMPACTQGALLWLPCSAKGQTTAASPTVPHGQGPGFLPPTQGDRRQRSLHHAYSNRLGSFA